MLLLKSAVLLGASLSPHYLLPPASRFAGHTGFSRPEVVKRGKCAILCRSDRMQRPRRARGCGRVSSEGRGTRVRERERDERRGTRDGMEESRATLALQPKCPTTAGRAEEGARQPAAQALHYLSCTFPFRSFGPPFKSISKDYVQVKHLS